MKAFQKMVWSVMALFMATIVVSCSSDDDDNNQTIINPSAVFTGGQPKAVAGMSMSYKNGLLTQITTEDGEKVTFNYGATRSNSQHIYMTIEDDESSDIMYFDLILGQNGFVQSCTETYSYIDDVDTWQFGYTSDGHLNYMKRSEGGNEVTTIKYEDGNITEVSMESEEDDDNLNTHISYVSDSQQTAIENKGCIMLFDLTFGIDMDEMKYAYWAGILGKATKHLPVKLYDVMEKDTEYFEWSLKNGYPESMISSWDEAYSFSW